MLLPAYGPDYTCFMSDDLLNCLRILLGILSDENLKLNPQVNIRTNVSSTFVKVSAL